MSLEQTRCALGAGKLASQIAFEITLNNSLVKDKDTLLDAVSKLIFNSEPYITELKLDPDWDLMLDTYAGEISLLLNNTVTELSVRYDNEDMFMPPGLSGAGLKKSLKDSINKSIDSKVNTLHKTPTVEVEEVQDSNKEGSVNEDYTKGESKEVETLEDYFNNLKGRRSKALEEGEIDVYQLYKYYFSDMPEQAMNFRMTFIQAFNSKLIDLSKRGMGYNPDTNEVINQLKAYFEDLTGKELSGFMQDGEVYTKDSLRDNEDALEQFFASVIVNEFDSVVKMFLPGIKKNVETGSYNLSTDSDARTTFSSHDGAFSGFDQTSDVMKMHIYTTPRVKQLSNGKWVPDGSKTLHEYEVRSVTEDLNRLPSDIEGFKTELSLLVNGGMSSKDPKLPILRSIYNKFFADSSEIYGDKSFYSFVENGVSEQDNNFMLQNVLTALIVDLRSKQNMEHVIVNNGKTIITRTQNSNVVNNLEKHFDSTISKASNRNELSALTSNKIQVLSNGNIKVLTKSNAGTIIEFEEGDLSKGKPVQVTGESATALNDINVANRVLQTIGFPGYLTKKFLEDYKYRTSYEDMNLANMVANMVYMVTVNDPAKHDQLNVKLPEPKLSEVNENGLKYSIFDKAHYFKKSIIKSAEEVEGIGANKMRINGDGNVVAVTGVRSRLYDLPNLINNLADIEGSVHADDIFVQDKYRLQGFYAKDGITVGGVRKGNSRMTVLEQHKYLMEDTFLKMAHENNYTSTLIQPGVMSDRSVVDLALINSNEGEFMPVTGKGRLDEKPLKAEFYNVQKNHIEANKKLVLDSWGKFMKGRGMSNNQIKEHTKSLDALNSWVDKNKITYDEASKSEDLVLHLMYVPTKIKSEGKSLKVVRLKQALIEMDKVFSSKVKANNFFKRQLNKFRQDLTEAGFSYNSLSNEAKTILKERFYGHSEEAGFEAFVRSYFYHTNTLSMSLMNLNMGSIYQFKGDMNYDDVLKNEDFKAIEGKVDDSTVTDLVLDIALNKMFVAQSKRNAGLGSGFQHPRYAKSYEKGRFLDETTNTAVIDDPELAMNILGDIRSDFMQEVYDASMFAHPLYFLKLNHSLGNNMSGFANQGGAVKDISNEVDLKTGILRFQKKATFNLFSNELLRKGNPSHRRLFNKMNESISFGKSGKNIKIPVVKRDRKGNYILTEDVITKDFKNLKELWDYFGGINNDGFEVRNSQDKKVIKTNWEAVLDVLAENPAIRNSYVEKVGFISGEKSGNRSINTKDVWEGKEPLKYTSFSNKYHGVILNSHHDFDTNASDEGHHDNEVSLITQIISAAAFEGNTAEVSQAINSAIHNLTDASLNNIMDSIYRKAMDSLREKVEKPLVNFKEGTEEDILAAKRLLDTPLRSESDNSQLDKLLNKYGLIDKAKFAYVKDLTKAAIETREAFSDTRDLINKEDSNLDSSQLYSVMHSSTLAAINRETVKMKYKGGQFVVSASSGFIKLYDVKLPSGSVVSMTRDEYMKSNLVGNVPLKNLKNLFSEDIIIVDGKETTVREFQERTSEERNTLLKEDKVLGKAIGEGRDLKWATYTSNTGLTNSEGEVITSVEQTDEYKDLIENAKKINDAKGDAKKKFLEERSKLKIAFRKVMENKDYGWKPQKAEFYMPMMHKSRFNLKDTDLLSEILGDHDYKSENQKERDKAFEHRVKYFTEKIEGKPTVKGKNGRRNPKYNLKQFKPIKSLDAEGLTKLKSDVVNKLGTKEPGTVEYNYLLAEKALLENVDSTDISPELIGSINNNRAASKKEYIRKIAEGQARSFPKTLEFIAARIPAQGKQSYIAGVIKGFINSNQNAMYGPSEMLTITGADHDIDKSNVMAYSVDEYGNLYDYKNYLVDGKISRTKLKEIIETKKADYLKSAQENNVDSKRIQEVIKSIEAKEANYFRESVKNFLVDKLVDSVMDPVNAVEAAQHISMDTLKDRVPSDIKIKLVNGVLVPQSSSFVEPYNPASKPVLELINSVGNDMIGIFASGIKGYSAVHTSAMTDPTKSAEFNGNLSGYSNDIIEAINEFYGGKVTDSKGTLYLFGKDGKVASSNRVANTKRFSIQNQNAEESVSEKFESFKLDYFDKNPESSYSEMVKAFDEATLEEADRVLLDESLSETQAWSQISELLSAATDNAKELILGKIGANGNTGGMMTAGLVLGFSLDETLDLFSQPDVVEIFNDLDKSRDTVARGKSMDLGRTLENYTHKHENNIRAKKALYESAKRGSVEPKVPTRKELKSNIIKVNSVEDIRIITNKGFSNSYESTGITINNTSTGKAEPRVNSKVSDKYKNEVVSPILNKLGIEGKPTLKHAGVLKVIDDSDAIVIVEGIDSNYEAIIKEYTNNSKDKTIYTLDSEGNWYKINKDGRVTAVNNPVLRSKVGFFSEVDLNPDQVKAFESAKNYTSKLITSQDAYNKFAEEIKNTPSEAVNQARAEYRDAVEKLTTDGFLQLKMLHKVSEEIKAVNSMILNQGLPNADWEIQRFFSNIVTNNDFIKDVYQFKAYMNTLNIKKFGEPIVPGMARLSDLEFNIINQNARKGKVAFNTLEVISNNDHYFGFIKAVLLAENLVRSSGFMNEAIESVIENYINPDVAKENPIKDNRGYNSVKNFIYGMTIEKYLKDNNITASINGKSYKLYDQEERPQFMTDAVSIVNTLQQDERFKNNPFVNALRVSTDRDLVYQVDTNIIKVDGMFSMEPHQLASLKLGVEELASVEPEIHAALYQYSLILNKGGRGQNSYASLFDPEMDAYKNYLSSLSSLDHDTIMSMLKNVRPESVLLSNYNSIPKKSTQAYTENGKKQFPAKNGTFRDVHYSLPPNNKNTPDVIRSTETGKVYKWHSVAKRYVVVTPKFNQKFIPFSYSKPEGSSLSILGAANFQYGETALLPDGSEVQVLYYVGGGLYKVVGKGGEWELSGDTLSKNNPNMVFRGKNFGRITPDEKTTEGFKSVREYTTQKEERQVTDGILSKSEDSIPYIDKNNDYKDLNNKPVYSEEGVNMLPQRDTHEHFGNPWTGNDEEGAIPLGKNDGSYKAMEATALKYRNWLLGKSSKKIAQDQRKWIIKQISEGKLDGQKLMDIPMTAEGKKVTSHSDVLLEIVLKGRFKTEPEQREVSNEESKELFEEDKSLETKIDELQNKLDVANNAAFALSSEIDPNISGNSKTEINKLYSKKEQKEMLEDLGKLESEISDLQEEMNALLKEQSDLENKKDDDNLEGDQLTLFHKEPVTYKDEMGKIHASQKVSKFVLKSVVDRLNSLLGPGVKKAKLMTSASIEEQFGKVYADKSGFVIDGQAVINSDLATLDTPIHEIGGHVFLQNLKNTRPDLYQELTSMAAEHPLAEYVMSKYTRLKSKEDIGEEVFSTLLGLESQGQLNQKDLNTWERMKDIAARSESILDFLRRFVDFIFGTNVDFELDLNTSLMEIIENLNKNIIFGDGSALKNLSFKTQEILTSAIDNVKTEEDIESRLKELGFIRNICR